MGNSSNCIGAKNFEEQLVDILGTKELADAEHSRVFSDDFKADFGDWEQNTSKDFKDKELALRQDDRGYPTIKKKGTQFYYEMASGKKQFINRIKFPELTPDEVIEIADQFRMELITKNSKKDFNDLDNLKNLDIAGSIKRSIERFKENNKDDEAALAKADLVTKYLDDFVYEVRTQIEDMGMSSKTRVVTGKNKSEIVDATDENADPLDEVAEDDKGGGINNFDSFTKNSKDTASVNIKLLLSQVQDVVIETIKVDGKNKKRRVPNRGTFFGMPKFVEFDDVWTTLEPRLSDIVNDSLGQDVNDVFELMLNEIDRISAVKPWAKGLAMDLRELDRTDKNKTTQFFQAFSKAKLTYYVTEVNGRNIKVINATSTNSRTNKIKAEWGSNFRDKFLSGKGELEKAADIEVMLDTLRAAQERMTSVTGHLTQETKNKLVKENIPVIFKALNQLGITTNDTDLRLFMSQLRDQEKIYGEVLNLFKAFTNDKKDGGILEFMLDDKTKFFSDGEYSNTFDTQSVLTRLAGAQALSATELSENTIVGNEGKTYWTYSSLTYLHNTIGRWKQEFGNSTEENSLVELAKLSYNKNSRWIKYLLAEDIDNTEKRAEESRKRIDAVDLGLSSSIKTKAKNDGVDNTKITIADALNDAITKILGKKAQAKKSIFPTIVPADKSRKIDIAGFEMYNSGIVYSHAKGEAVITDYTTDIFIDYFEDEYRRMSEVSNDLDTMDAKDKVEYYHTGKNPGALRSHLFPGLSPQFLEGIDKDLYKALYDAKGRPLGTAVDGLTGTQKERLKDYVKETLEGRVQDTLADLADNGLITQDVNGKFVSVTLDTTLLGSYNSDVYAIAGDYLVNGLISTIEYTKMFSGDPAYYKTQADMIKRVPATYTDGLQLRLSKADHKYFNHAVIEGVEVASAYLGEIVSSLKKLPKEEGVELIKEGDLIPGSDVAYPAKYRGLSEERAKVGLAYDSIPGTKYSGVNTTDAQAWITPNRWRFLKKKLGQWGPQHDKVFDKMINGGTLDYKELKLAAQPLKGVYFEINDGRPVYLKYSQAVLTPALVANTPMQKLYDKMTKDADGKELGPVDEIHEVITIDGVKVGAKGMTKIHRKGSTKLMDNIELNSSKLLNAGWKLQQDLPTKLVHNTLVGSQLQKNILMGLDLTSNEKDYNIDGEAMAAKDVLKKIHETVSSLSDAGRESLSKKFGIVDGKITDMSAVYDSLIDEFKSRGGDENIISALEKEMPLDSIPQISGRVQGILMSVFNKELVKIKTNGGSFIQVSPFGIESVQEIVKVDNDGGPKKVIRSGIKIVSDNFDGKGLKPPRIDKNGKVLPGQVMLPYSALRDAVNSYNQSLPKDAAKLDISKLSGAELKKILDPSALQMVGYRIPNQGMSSNDALEIVGILPPELGDSIVAYDAIPGKTGSDFDIDKMFAMSHHLEVVDGKITKVDPAGDTKKAMQNRLVDIYYGVLTSPRAYESVMTSIDSSFFKDDILGLFSKTKMKDLQFYSPTEQIKTKFEYISGKFGVAMTANQMVDHASNQSLTISLKSKLGIGHTDSKGRPLFDNIKDTNGEHKIADVLSAFLNAYVDIAKDPYVTRGNHNIRTAGVTFMLLRAGVPVSFVNRLVGQPILQDLVHAMNISEGKTADKLRFANGKVAADAFEYVRKKYNVKKGAATEVDVARLTETNMEANIKKGRNEMDQTEKFVQGRILDIFEYLSDVSKVFNAGVSAAKADTKGNNGSSVNRHIAENKKRKAVKSIIGFASKYNKTMIGTYHENAVTWVGDVLESSDILLVGKKAVLDAFDGISSRMGKGLLENDKLGAILESAYRSYSMSSLSLFKNNNAEHHKLFVQLPQSIRAFKNSGKKNFLINELNIKDSGGYQFLSIDSRRATKSFNNRMYRAWTALLTSNDLTERSLGMDLVKYAYSQSGFNNNLNEFFTHIPHTVFSERSVAREFDEMFNNVEDETFHEEFMDQMMRHEWDNKKLNIVPEVFNSNVDGITASGTGWLAGFQYDDTKKSIAVEVNSRTGVKKYPAFIKMVANAEYIKKNPEKTIGKIYNLYELAGRLNNNTPVYIRTHKLGMKANKGSVVEYLKGEQSSSSVIVENNVPADVKKSVAKLLSHVRENPFWKEGEINDSQFYTGETVDSSREVSTKIINDKDTANFNEIVNRKGTLPEKFFTHSTKYKQILSGKTKSADVMPQDHSWILDQGTGRYDMMDMSTGEVIYENVDLKTGLQYEEANLDDYDPGAQEERITNATDYVAEEMSVFRQKVAHMQEKMNVQVILDDSVPTSRVLAASDPRTIKYGKPVILVNPNAVFKTTAIHEFAHIFVDAFPGGLKNPRMQKALKELEGTELWNEVKEKYSDLSEEAFHKEVLATAIGREGSDIWDNQEKQSMWTAFKNWFFDFLRRKFGVNKSEVVSLTKELLDNRVKTDLSKATMPDYIQEMRHFGKEQDPDIVDLNTTYDRIISSISNLKNALTPKSPEAKASEEANRQTKLREGKETKLQIVEELDKKLTKELELGTTETYYNSKLDKEFKKLDQTMNVRAMLRYTNFAKGGIKAYKKAVSSLQEGGALDAAKIKEIKFYTSVFELIPDVKNALLAEYKKGKMVPDGQTAEAYEKKKNARLAELDRIMADYDTLSKEMLAASRDIYVNTMVENSNEHITVHRRKFEREYALLDKKGQKPDENIYEWVNQKMIDNADQIESEAFEFYKRTSEESVSDIAAATGWLVSEKNIANAEIQTMSRLIDRADSVTDSYVQAKAKEVEEIFKSFAEDNPGGINQENRYKKFVEQTENGTYLLSRWKVDFMKQFQEVNSWLNYDNAKDKFGSIKVAEDGAYTLDGKEKLLGLQRNAFTIKGDKAYYMYKGTQKSMPLSVAIAQNERNIWLIENTVEVKENGVTIHKPIIDKWENKDWVDLSAADKKHLVKMKVLVGEADKLTKGEQSLIESAGGEKWSRLPGITKSSEARLLSGNVGSAIADKFTDAIKRKSDEFELEEEGSKKARKESGSVRRMADLSNKQKYEVAIPYRAKLDKKEQSLDIHTILLMNLKEAKNHEQKKQLEAQAHVIIDVMSNRLVPNHSGMQKLSVLHGFSKSREIKLHLPKDKLPQDVQTLISIVENRIYSIKNKDAGEIMGMNVQKATNTLLKYAGSVALIGNFINSTVNATTGTVNNLIEAWGGETYNLTNWKNAGLKYWKDAPNMMNDMGNFTHSSNTNMMLDLFNVLGSRSSLNNNFEDNSRLKSMMKTSKLRPIAQGGEHMMQAKVMYAVMDGIKVLNKKGQFLNKEGKVVKEEKDAATIDEVITFDKGQYSLPKWVKATTFSPQPKAGDEHLDIINDTRGLIKKKIIDLHGNYDNDLKNKAQREWWGKLLFFLKKWMVATSLRRWRGLATANKASEELRDVDLYFSEDMKAYQEGYYTTAIRFITNSLWPALKEAKFEMMTADYSKLTKHEKANMRRLAAEIGMMSIMLLAYMAMGGFDEEPDEDTVLYRYFLRRELSELSFYLNPAETFKLMKNPSASISVIERFMKVLGQVTSPYERYEQGNNTGRLKLWVKTRKALPFLSQTEKDIKASLRFLQIMD